MTNYSNDISKIYSFIQKQGIWKMDLNNNGEIIEAECKYFLKQNLEEIDLQDKSKADDIIFQFWRSINTDRSVKSIASLDAKEIEAMNKRIAMEELLLKYTENLKAPKSLQYSDWKGYVTDELKNAIENHGGMESFKTEQELEAFIKQNLKDAEYKATVVCVCDTEKSNALKSDAFKNAGINEENFPADLQKEIQKFIDDAIENRVDFEGDELVTYISDSVKTIIETYTKRQDATDLKVEQLRKKLLSNLQEAAKEDDEVKSMVAKFGQDAVYKAMNDFLTTEYVKTNFSSLKETDNLLDKFKESTQFTDIRKNLQRNQAQEVVMSLLTPTEEQTYFNYAENLKTEKGEDWFYEDSIWNYFSLEFVLQDVLGEKYDSSKSSDYIKEALDTGLDALKKDDCNEIIKYVLRKFGIDETTKRSGETADSELLTALVKAGVDRELAKAILSLTPEDRAKYSEYTEKLNDIIQGYADGIIKDKSALVDKLANEIKTLVDKKVFQDMQDAIENSRKVEDKSKAIMESFKSDKNRESIGDGEHKDKFTFYLDKNGNIIFVDYDNATSDKTLFNSDKNEALQNYFALAKNHAEDEYKDKLNALGFTEQEKDNLYNAALYLTLTDTSVVSSFYNLIEIDGVVEKFIENYTKLLQKAASNDKAREYIKNWNQNSYLAGTTTNLGDSSNRIGSDMQGSKLTTDFGVENNKTGGNDNKIATTKTKTHYINYGDNKGGNILHLDGNGGDEKYANGIMDKMVDGYVQKYGIILGVNTVIDLFNKAQQAALDKIKNQKDKDDRPDDQNMEGYELYAYGDHGNSVNTIHNRGKYYSISALLIQIEVEMERLIGQAVLNL